MRKLRGDMRPSQASEYIEGPQPVILEIGCNDGTDTNRFLEVFPNGRIWCFEPDHRAIARYRETVTNPRATLCEVALSDKDGEATFYGSSGQVPQKQRRPGVSHYCYLDEWDLSGSLCKPTGHLKMSPWTTFPENRQFPVMTMKLDTWYAAEPAVTEIDFAWVDVQGAEHLVIAGAQETLKHVNYWYTEFYNTPMYEGQVNLKELKELLPGFELVALYGTTNALFKRR